MFSFTRASVFALAVATASVSAQAVSNVTISKECTSTLFNLALSPEASSCFNTPDLINAVINKTQTLNDPIGAATTWVNGLCANGWCSENALQTFIQNITTGCSEDLQNTGVKIDFTPDTMDNIQHAYKAVREIVCLKDTSSGDLCAIDTLNEVKEFADNFLSINTVFSLFTGGHFDVNAGKTFLQSTLIPNLKTACTNCAKAAFSVAKRDFPALVSQADSDVSSVCGADFVNGEIPANIQATAKNASATSLLAKNAAATVFGRVSGVQLGAVVFAAALGLLL
jgi:hypothetical protein